VLHVRPPSLALAADAVAMERHIIVQIAEKQRIGLRYGIRRVLIGMVDRSMILRGWILAWKRGC
jgi:hypothetical protein